MKIAFISYEFPPETAFGGIATYVFQAAHMLRDRGHHVEVIAGMPGSTRTRYESGILTHRLQVDDPLRFAEPAGHCFAARHAEVGFDVLEGPEFVADARVAVELVPDVPLVVKLHTPSSLLLRLNYLEPSWRRRAWLFAWGWAHGYPTHWGYSPEIEGHRLNVARLDAIERAHALEADEIAAPSLSLGEWAVREWGVDRTRLAHVPYPFVPATELLSIPVETDTRTVTFIGRLERRKGVIDLADAIPAVLERRPDAKFRFVGASESSPRAGQSMCDFLAERLAGCVSAVTFDGPVEGARLPQVLAGSDICVFPSIWENFPCVCLEAMAAARAVVGSSSGGMAEMLDAGRAGVLVPPRDPRAIAAALIDLLEDPARRWMLGRAARERLLSVYGAARIAEQQLAGYQRAIDRRRRLGPRSGAVA